MSSPASTNVTLRRADDRDYIPLQTFGNEQCVDSASLTLFVQTTIQVNP